MKKVILILVLIAIVFIAVMRNRLFLRDPFATVFIDGEKQSGTQVYINFQNEVFLENDNPPAFIKVIQHNNHIGPPTEMHGMHWLVMLSDADVAPLLQPDTTSVVDSMTAKQVVYHQGRQVTTITLR
jgi:hypothetical protein